MTPATVEAQIAAGKSNADLIDWALAPTLFDSRNDPQESIAASIAEFVAAGWRWNELLRQLEKDGWYAFYRSQGILSPPIIQWRQV